MGGQQSGVQEEEDNYEASSNILRQNRGPYGQLDVKPEGNGRQRKGRNDIHETAQRDAVL